MQLSNIRIPLTAKSHWSALDLGCVLARRWWVPLFLVWVIPAVLVFVLFSVVAYQYLWVSMFAVWWLKPVFDQLCLYMGSRLLFGENVSVRSVLRQFWPIVKKDWWCWISFRRLSLTRSFDLPITTLEQLTGPHRARRKQALHQQGASAATWLTILLLHFEYVLVYGLMLLFYLMLPQHVELDWSGLASNDLGLIGYFSNILFCIAMAIVAPFYTMAGFVLYLNRRIVLEGWDIELQFRRLAERTENAGMIDQTRSGVVNKSGLVMVALIGLLTWSAIVPQSRADTGEVQIYSTKDSKQAIEDVLESELFHQKQVVKKWQRKDLQQHQHQATVPDWIISFFRAAESFASAITGVAVMLEWAGWGGLILLLFYLVYRYRHTIYRGFGFFQQKPPLRQPPAVLFGLEVTTESLPVEVVSEAVTLWHNDEPRKAIGLLYRASLSRLLHQYQCMFDSSDTEYECLEKVRQMKRAEITSFVGSLTIAWQNIAYGHIRIPDSGFKQLCEQWKEVLG